MGRKKKTTKAKIVSAAWKLFYKKGYEDTTVDEIIALSGTSKGSFYHYFSGKDALLGTLSDVFDENYEELMQQLDPDMNSYDKLLRMGEACFEMVNTTISMELLASLLSSQVAPRGEKYLMDQNRYYYRMLNRIVTEGQLRGELTADIPAHEIVKIYTMTERSLLYDWCICQGNYSLVEYGVGLMNMFLQSLRASKGGPKEEKTE